MRKELSFSNAYGERIGFFFPERGFTRKEYLFMQEALRLEAIYFFIFNLEKPSDIKLLEFKSR